MRRDGDIQGDAAPCNRRVGVSSSSPRGVSPHAASPCTQAEVFSFTSLLYHFLSHQKPFSWMTPDMFLADACRNGKRPPLSGKWPGDVQALMAAGWSSDSRARPEFAKVVVTLEEAIGRPQSLAEVLERSKAPSSRSSAQ